MNADKKISANLRLRAEHYPRYLRAIVSISLADEFQGVRDMAYKHANLTSVIIGAFYDVYNELGYGFLEKVYENALVYELMNRGYNVHQQAPIKVYYGELLVGQYFADILVNDSVIIELKAAEAIAEEHEAQLINYLKATEIDVGLILNFGPKPQVMRKVFETAREDASR